MSPVLPPLKYETRAELFRQLAAMEQAGLPVDRALGLLRLPRGVQPRVAAMRKWLGLGFGIGEAGLRCGLFTDLESALVHAACNAGSPARTYHRLADYCARRAARVAKMKSRLMLPLAMLLIADFLGPLPKVFAGSLSPGGYLLRCLLPLIALVAAVVLYTELPRRLPADSLAMRKIRLDADLLRLPWFGPMIERRNVRDFLDSLALLLEAGMPILQGLPIALDAMRNQEMRQRFSQIKPHIEAGASFEQALGVLSFAGHEQAMGLIQAGEVSGTLPEALFRCSDNETATIERFDDFVAEWTPRLVYTVTALWIGYGIIHSGAFMPSLPADLR